MAVYFAIGDVHGCFDASVTLYAKIESIIGQEFQDRSNVFIVFLGDYVDRGPGSKSVIDFLIQLDPHKHIILPGNHEMMMLEFLTEGGDRLARIARMWFTNGGLVTLASYIPEKDHPVFNRKTRYDISSLISARALVPEDHKAFLIKLFENRCPYFKDDDDQLFFCHAGVNLSKRLKDQTLDDFLWSRYPELIRGETRWIEGFKVIHGHTPIGDQPKISANRISVDTGCCYDGKLSAVVLVDGVATSVLQS